MFFLTGKNFSPSEIIPPSRKPVAGTLYSFNLWIRRRAVASESFGGFAVRSTGGIETKPIASFRAPPFFCPLTISVELDKNTASKNAEVSNKARHAVQAELAMLASVFIFKIL